MREAQFSPLENRADAEEEMILSFDMSLEVMLQGTEPLQRF